MAVHSRAILEKMLPKAQNLVAEGAQRIRAQEARVAVLEQKGAIGEQSKKLLAIMKQTQELQIGHVALLKRELASSIC